MCTYDDYYGWMATEANAAEPREEPTMCDPGNKLNTIEGLKAYQAETWERLGPDTVAKCRELRSLQDGLLKRGPLAIAVSARVTAEGVGASYEGRPVLDTTRQLLVFGPWLEELNSWLKEAFEVAADKERERYERAIRKLRHALWIGEEPPGTEVRA